MNLEKQCKVCNTTKPTSEFYVSFSGVNGNIYKSNCKSCHKIKSKIYAQSNPLI